MRRWTWAVVLASAVATAAVTPASVQRRVAVNKARRQAQEAAFAAFQTRHAAAPQRSSSSICLPDGQCVPRGVQAALREGHGLFFCRDCGHAASEGLYAATWEAHRHSFEGYNITAEVVHAVPNDGSAPLLNIVGGALCLFQRGAVPFAAKVRVCQQAGGVGAIIVDSHATCNEAFECSDWLGSRADGALGATDAPTAWAGVHIPAVLVTAATGARLRALLREEALHLPQHGQQWHVP